MAGLSTRQWDSLERWSPNVFLIATGFLIVHAAHHGLEAFTAVAYPWHHELPFGVIGMILGFVGLLGLYPALSDRTPRLAGGGAVLAVLGAVGWIVIGGATLAEEVGASPPEWLGAFGLLIIGGVVLAYTVFSVASLRTKVVSRTVGLALLAPVVVMVGNIAIATSGNGGLTGQFAVSSGFALAHLAIGVALRTEYGSTGRADPTPEATA